MMYPFKLKPFFSGWAKELLDLEQEHSLFSNALGLGRLGVKPSRNLVCMFRANYVIIYFGYPL
jgi:hypothetical protein